MGRALHRRELLIGGLAVTLAATIAEAARPELGAGIGARVDAAVARAIARGGVPGAAVAIARQGQIVFERAYGFADLETLTPATIRSVFRIGSLTKQFTAAAMVKLAEAGRLRLDDPLAEVLPRFPKAGEVTFRQLLVQTAGLHDGAEEGALAPTARDASDVEIAESIGRQPIVYDFAPGTAWHYSNPNYLVLGGVIEKVSGQPFSTFMQAELFTPAGLAATAVDDESEVVPGRASGYSPVAVHPGAYANAAYLPIAQAGGAGAMRSTVGDLCRWHDALLHGRVVSRTGVDQMMAPGRFADGRTSGANRFTPDERLQFAGTEYGMGLVLATERGRRLIAHQGGINGFAAYLASCLDPQVTVAILTNCDNNPDDPMRDLRRLFGEVVAAA